jgi:hypothetical protein
MKIFENKFCGAVVELDVVVISSSTSAIPVSNGGFRHLLLEVDSYSSFLMHVPIRILKHPVRFLKHPGCGSTIPTPIIHIKHFKLDVQFNTIAVILYRQSILITFQFSPRYEHKYTGKIERANRTSQDKISCALAISAIPDKRLFSE